MVCAHELVRLHEFAFRVCVRLIAIQGAIAVPNRRLSRCNPLTPPLPPLSFKVAAAEQKALFTPPHQSPNAVFTVTRWNQLQGHAHDVTCIRDGTCFSAV